MRNEFALRSRTGVRASFMALTFASGSRAVPHATADDAGHGAFMALPRYTRIREGEVHSRGLGVRNCSRRARSRPLSEPGESIERACEATSAEGTARCARLVAWAAKRGGSSAPFAARVAHRPSGWGTHHNEGAAYPQGVHRLSTLGKSDTTTTVMVPMFVNIPSSIR
jgi:hypothetical protein